MKRLVFAAALSVTALAFADTVQSTDTFGVLKIGDTTSPTVVLCVPWKGVDNEDVKVANLIMTSNRKADDELYYYDTANSAYRAWKMNADGANGGTWTAFTEVSSSGITPGAIVSDKTAERGEALILVRKPNDASANPLTYPEVYLYGKYTSTAGKTTITAPGAGVAQVFNLIAPTKVESSGYDMTNKGADTGTSINPADCIRINNVNRLYQYRNNKWGYYTGGATKNQETGEWELDFTEGLTIPAGEGAWYISRGGSPKFTW